MGDEMKVNIRWLIRRDLPEVLEIERDCFQDWPWTEDDYMTVLRQRNCIVMVAEHRHEVVGVMVYELLSKTVRILNFAVAPNHQRCGIGSKMVDRLKDKLFHQRRKEIVLEVRETNVPAQEFFSEQGFIAVDVLREHYEDTDEDAYMFRYWKSEGVLSENITT